MVSEGRVLNISREGVLWAYTLGEKFRQETEGYRGLRTDKMCPFKEGSPWRLSWYAGRRGKRIPYDLVTI